MRLAKPLQPVDNSWKQTPIKPRGTTKLGFSLRPRQIEAFGLNVEETLEALLALPFELVRLPAYWNQIEAQAGGFDTSDLERQLAAVERAGKQVILAIGPVKNFGYPEFYVPPHQLAQPLREGSVVRPSTHAELLAGATRFIRRVIERFGDRPSIVAWQLEHESVDPLGVEHSWRLGADFVERELDALRGADPSRPVMMSGFLPTSSVVGLSQWWQTRDQGDSLAIARRLADIVGIDYYPRHALFRLGPITVYLDGSRTIDELWRRNKKLMVSEGQAEPWEAVTVPPNPGGLAMFSCSPDALIRNYNSAMEWSSPAAPLGAYLFWGADYWVLRDRSGDASYLEAVNRILTEA